LVNLVSVAIRLPTRDRLVKAGRAVTANERRVRRRNLRKKYPRSRFPYGDHLFMRRERREPSLHLVSGKDLMPETVFFRAAPCTSDDGALGFADH
jgi:hypothetical protein